MGSYDKWIGDVEDYTDEEVCDYSVRAVAETRIVRLRLAWCWVVVRKQSGAMLAGEAAVADRLAGGGLRRGQLRMLAEELYTLVTVPEDGEVVVQLGPWRIDDVAQLEIEGARRDIRKKSSGVSAANRAGDLLKKAPLRDLATLYAKEVEGELRRAATMTRAIPRYNRLVRKSSFPEAMWSWETRRMFNKVMHRLETELGVWNKCLEALSPSKEGR